MLAAVLFNRSNSTAHEGENDNTLHAIVGVTALNCRQVKMLMNEMGKLIGMSSYMEV